MSLAFYGGFIIALCAVSTLFTEAIKKFCDNGKINYATNLVAFICAFVVGILGSVGVYILKDIPFTLDNIVVIIFTAFLIWMGSMIGYDKILQLVDQIKEIITKKGN